MKAVGVCTHRQPAETIRDERLAGGPASPSALSLTTQTGGRWPAFSHPTTVEGGPSFRAFVFCERVGKRERRTVASGRPQGQRWAPCNTLAMRTVCPLIS
jgi:hypothetical protein